MLPAVETMDSPSETIKSSISCLWHDVLVTAIEGDSERSGPQIEALHLLPEFEYISGLIGLS